jgi:hypothetical protein
MTHIDLLKNAVSVRERGGLPKELSGQCSQIDLMARADSHTKLAIVATGDIHNKGKTLVVQRQDTGGTYGYASSAA